jgi:homoserine dehydrogenase
MQKTMDTPLLNDIAFDLVKDKVIADKMEEYKMTNEQKENLAKNENKESQKEKSNKEEEDFENEDDLDEVDSEEERIISKQIQQRLEQQDKKIEAEKARLARKYGDVRDIVETEFLDIMTKHNKVVCHFYHDQFERCKIMDKHFRQMADLHPETLFVRINAEKTPFFTNKLNIKVVFVFNF